MKIGQTDSIQNVNVRLFGGIDMSTRWDRFALFGESKMLQKGNIEFTLQSRWDRSLTSVRPKRYEGKQRVGQANSVGHIRSFR